MRTVVIVAVAGPLVLGGCATVSPDEAFSDVQRVAAERLGISEVRWNRGTPEDKAASEPIARVLEGSLTPEAAVQIALFNNQRLQAEYERIGIARADLLQAGLLENPTLGAEILVGGGVSPSVSIVQNVLSVATLSARRTVAASAFESAKLEVAQKVLDVAAEVRSAYYGLVADQQAADLFRQVVSATEAAADLSQRQLSAGNIGPRDQALQQAQYAQVSLELARIEARIAVDREALNRLLGLSGDQTAWNLPERLPDLPTSKPPIDGLETVALERRVDLAGARQDVQTAAMTLDLAHQLRFLSFLGLGVKFERDPESGGWSRGPVIELALPIFDQGQARIATLESERRRSEKLYIALATDVRAEVRAAWAQLVAAQDAASFYRTNLLPLQEQIVAESNRLATGMLISVYDLIRSRQDQINAARDYIGVLRDYWMARAHLERALAGPLPTEGAGTTAPSSQDKGS